MADERSQEVWTGIVAILEEKLQYGFLKQAEFVVDVKFDGDELTLYVASQDALEFFRSEVNQQRLMIIGRPVAALETVVVEKVEAEPLR